MQWPTTCIRNTFYLLLKPTIIQCRLTSRNRREFCYALLVFTQWLADPLLFAHYILLRINSSLPTKAGSHTEAGSQTPTRSHTEAGSHVRRMLQQAGQCCRQRSPSAQSWMLWSDRQHFHWLSPHPLLQILELWEIILNMYMYNTYIVAIIGSSQERVKRRERVTPIVPVVMTKS